MHGANVLRDVEKLRELNKRCDDLMIELTQTLRERRVLGDRYDQSFAQTDIVFAAARLHGLDVEMFNPWHSIDPEPMAESTELELLAIAADPERPHNG